ncbi:hypothetical protein [Pantoea agglomerans]|uniref:hypothetical protein n=1 Tax=Enterobacter agglomerans TaxID=549 RepID=UPI0010506137|nr:hypothetical protein [Pantoea agglomerans]TCZ21956.1 hypothetical protein EYB39_23090 [Pantoea agglomerans]
MPDSPVEYVVNFLFRPESHLSAASAPHETMPQDEGVSSARLGAVTNMFASNMGSDSLSPMTCIMSRS